MQSSSIEWTDVTWNPVTGCDQVSPGCKNCYALRIAERFRGIPDHPYEYGFDLRLWESRLEQPLRWRKPRRVFVNSMSDLFHPRVPEGYIQKVFAVMAEANQHQFQVLTKRHKRLKHMSSRLPWPPHIWMGVSIENNQYLERAESLKNTAAHIKFLSCEPLLGPIDLTLDGIDWVIAGGESGPKARPMQAAWVRSIRDQCRKAQVPFFFKQWGTYDCHGIRQGKKKSGRVLDGIQWDEYPHHSQSEGVIMDKQVEEFWGGPQTIHKLDVVGKYLDAYTTALKNQPFQLVYVDAFAGSGHLEMAPPLTEGSSTLYEEIENVQTVREGSAKIALSIADKSFDNLIFVEKDNRKIASLRALAQGNESRVDIRQGDANHEVQDICQRTDWCRTRAIVFLDPYGAQVEWLTLKAIVNTRRIDMFCLFPVSTIQRLLPVDRLPREAWCRKLNAVFGGDAWRSLYTDTQQSSWIEDGNPELRRGEDKGRILALYKKQLEKDFAYVDSIPLHDRRNRHLFELIFAVANPDPKARRLARRIVRGCTQTNI